ncbi:MAG: hypothetical protein EOO98_12875 [Pedobacter sp.]|nr:MAG: hypothetical protein EOO98_12875 [Pedobacter sp.]
MGIIKGGILGGFRKIKLSNETMPARHLEVLKIGLSMVCLLMSWPLLQQINLTSNPTAGYIDMTILILVAISMLSFASIVGLVSVLLSSIWKIIGLPAIGIIVSQFKSLTSWQQLGFLYASFALLLSAAVGCLVAIC